jgi:hypothetical protein
MAAELRKRETLTVWPAARIVDVRYCTDTRDGVWRLGLLSHGDADLVQAVVQVSTEFACTDRGTKVPGCFADQSHFTPLPTPARVLAAL